MVVVAQLVRALDCGSRGRRFETGLPPFKNPSRYRGVFLYLIIYYLSASTAIGASFSANQEVVKIKSSDPRFCE